MNRTTDNKNYDYEENNLSCLPTHNELKNKYSNDMNNEVTIENRGEFLISTKLI